MLTSIAGLMCFAGFVAVVHWCGSAAADQDPGKRKRRVSFLLLYAVGASFAAGLSQHDEWPFVAWPLVAAKLPAVVTQPRLVAVDARGVERMVDYRAWWPLSFDELTAWMDHASLQLLPAERNRAARGLLALAEASRKSARRGEGVGHFDRFLGPATAPFFLLHPALWSRPDDVPPDSLVGLRFYEETWNVDQRAAGAGPVSRILVYSYPHRF